MRYSLLALTVTLFMAGCASESDPGKQAATTATTAGAIAQAASATSVKLPAGHGFASLPDRGALIKYERSQAPQQRGAFTYLPAELSEAHILNATVPGRAISLTTPDGQPMRIAYQRHEESLDGNWTWIGETQDGLRAVITFGEKAVFGKIEQKATEALRITTLNGRTWIMQADPSKLLDGNLRRDAESDTLIPAKTAAGAASAQVGTLANAANTVDVALGYTAGMIARYGGATQVNTRLVNLMAITNQAYQDSQITPRVRLVHTMQVDYTDTNSNDTALEALTGYTCTTSGCTQQPVPVGLQGLRAARDAVGADLVSLVRPFNTPEHDGCGIAWLLGGGGSTIDNSDAGFGYSVVSDGQDKDEGDGKTYFCREETLAHELGHNMGQAHNPEDSSGQGAHSYSYGYREAATNGFYTVMAYRLGSSTQFSIPYFGNPSVIHPGTGRPTGSATADNARSLNQTMPLIAQFRASLIPDPTKVRNDINGDGNSDLIWYNAGAGSMAYWFMNNTSVVSSGSFSVGTAFRIVGTGDFDGDNRTDLLWFNSSNNQLHQWRSLGNGQFSSSFVGAIGAGWAVAETPDLNGDGKSDIVWENTATGTMAYWIMNGSTTVSTRVYTVGTAYRVVASGDFDGDGRGDLIWANASQGYLYLWRSRPDGNFDTPFLAAYGTSWNIAGVTDLNGDGKSDLVWEEPTQGMMAQWWMNGANIQYSSAKSVGTAYRIATTGDLNGDTRGDIIWANASTGLMYLWRSRGDGEFDTPFLASYSTAWSLIP
ncbi:FG-GAP-like repeat-containing protein [Lysobacter sp. 5GHs7-4]|uniref:FG-GAP-like repeat-containing protein n=1 Tax=Lysobacter sp. 5GHs7-4 TaxID=2904253 RepID=UPI001E5EF68D|nr:FG-GAP-like repeat-containing protein [Lysobacter sp. 5GHs7-4]UHQ22671.1 FG-GAP-like repeat-containing protein [Lysobacter sp. 5GHs7-4]